MGLISEILDQTPTDEQIYDAVFEDEPEIPPTEDLNEHIAKNIEKSNEQYKLENNTHGQCCNDCVKAQNNTGNPRAVMRYCRYNGVMVSKFQPNCERFILNTNKDPF